MKIKIPTRQELISFINDSLAWIDSKEINLTEDYTIDHIGFKPSWGENGVGDFSIISEVVDHVINNFPKAKIIGNALVPQNENGRPALILDVGENDAIDYGGSANVQYLEVLFPKNKIEKLNLLDHFEIAIGSSLKDFYLKNQDALDPLITKKDELVNILNDEESLSNPDISILFEIEGKPYRFNVHKNPIDYVVKTEQDNDEFRASQKLLWDKYEYRDQALELISRFYN